MFGHRKTLRWLAAVYMAVLMPFCCCYTSVYAVDPVPSPSHDHAEPGHDHGRRSAADAGHRHESHDVHGQQAPCGPKHSCDPGSHDHEGECDCGCSSGPAAFTVEAPHAADLAFTSAPALVPIIDSAPVRHKVMIRTAALCRKPNTSLLRQHCALIV